MDPQLQNVHVCNYSQIRRPQAADNGVPTPELGGDEVLFAVQAASINSSDVRNVPRLIHGTVLPHIPGRDFAGAVVGCPAELIGLEGWGTGGNISCMRDGSHAQRILLPPIDASILSPPHRWETLTASWNTRMRSSTPPASLREAGQSRAVAIGLALIPLPSPCEFTYFLLQPIRATPFPAESSP